MAVRPVRLSLPSFLSAYPQDALLGPLTFDRRFCGSSKEAAPWGQKAGCIYFAGADAIWLPNMSWFWTGEIGVDPSGSGLVPRAAFSGDPRRHGSHSTMAAHFDAGRKKICQCHFAGAEANPTRFRRSVGRVGPGGSFLNFVLFVVGTQRTRMVDQRLAASDSCFAIALPRGGDGRQCV